MKAKFLHFFDIETAGGLGGYPFYIYVIKTDESYKPLQEFEFFSAKEFFEEYIKKNKGIYIAHNGGKFDFVKLFAYLKPYVNPEKTVYRHGLKKLTLRGELSGRIFLDSYGLIPLGLKKFKEAFNLSIGKKQYKGISHINPLLLTQEEFEKLREYTRYDVLTLIEGFKTFEKLLNDKLNINVKLFHFTSLPSLSFAVFKKKLKEKYNKKPYYLNAFDNLYHGGRTEVIKFYGKNLYYIDINSSYPNVMQKYTYPFGKLKKTNDIENEGVVVIRFNDDTEFYIPPFPIKTKNKLLFANMKQNDFFATTNAFARFLEKLGVSFEIIKAYESEESLKLFEYIGEFYELRKKTKDKGLKTVLKLLMNSAYGKFGQKPVVDIVTPYGFCKRISRIYRNVLIAAYITEYARIELYKGIRKIGEKHVYYTDTDSLFSDRIEPSLIGDELGMWKVEDEIKEFKAYAPKVYEYESKTGSRKIKFKGIQNPKHIKGKHLITSTASLKKGFKYKMWETSSETKFFRELKTDYNKRVKIDEVETRPYNTEEVFTLFGRSKNVVYALQKYNSEKASRILLEIEFKNITPQLQL